MLYRGSNRRLIDAETGARGAVEQRGHHMGIFDRYLAAFSVTAAALCAAPASAAVLYEFSGAAGSFSLTSAQYITADTTIAAGDLDSCSSTGPCLSILFDPQNAGQGLYDRIGFRREAGGPGFWIESYHYFDLGAFGQNGTYASLLGINPATLRVSGTADPTGAVPEPATWAMLILGFGLVGGAMRSAKRRQTATIAFA